MNTLLVRAVGIFIILVMALCFTLCGCGGGGSKSGGAVSVPAVVAESATGTVEAVVERPLAKDFPAGTTSIRVRVQQNGADVVPAQTVLLPSPGQRIVVTFANVPVGSATLVIESLDAGGRTLDTSSSQVTVLPGVTTRAPVVVTVTSFSISPASATAAPRANVTFSGVGGARPYTFSILSNASGALIDAATGVYTAGAAGNTQDVVRVTDASGGTASANVTVGPTISITPATATVPVRGVQTFTVTGGSGAGLQWSLPTNRSGATIDASGKYTAGATGNVSDVVKAVDSLGNSATVDVSVGPLVQISPSTQTVNVGAQIPFSASGGSGTGYQWTVSTNLSGATIDASGTYTAGLVGAVTDVVTVTDSLGNAATTSVVVNALLLVTPAAPTVAPLQTVSFSASGGKAPFTFTLATNASGGSISTSGAYQAGVTGSTTDVVECSDSGGNKTNVNVAVGPGVSIGPSPLPTIGPLGTVSFTVSGGSGTGYTWSFFSNASGGTLDASTGAYAAGLTGSVVDTIKVVDSLGNSKTVDVALAARLTTPSNLTVAPNGTTTITPVGGSGTYTYSLPVNQSGGSIDASGSYTAGPGGTDSLGFDIVLVNDAVGGFPAATIVSVGGTFTVTVGTQPVNMVGFGDQFTVKMLGGTGTGLSWVFNPNPSGCTVTPVPLTNSATVLAGQTPSVVFTNYLQVQDSGANTAAMDFFVGDPTPGFKLNATPDATAVTSGSTVTLDGTQYQSPAYQWEAIYNPTLATFSNAFSSITTMTPVVTKPTRIILALTRNGHFSLGTLDVTP